MTTPGQILIRMQIETEARRLEQEAVRMRRAAVRLEERAETLKDVGAQMRRAEV